MDKRKQKILLITFCVFLLLWNFPLLTLFEAQENGAKSIWVLILMFLSWLAFIIALWATASLYMSGHSKPNKEA